MLLNEGFLCGKEVICAMKSKNYKKIQRDCEKKCKPRLLWLSAVMTNWIDSRVVKGQYIRATHGKLA